LTVLDRPQVAGEVQDAADVGAVFGASLQSVDGGERREYGDDERARAAQSGGGREVAREGEVGPAQ